MPNAKKIEKEETPWASWDTCEIAEWAAKDKVDQAKANGEELDYDKAFIDACGDSCLYDSEWEYVIESLTELMKEYDKGDGAWVERFLILGGEV